MAREDAAAKQARKKITDPYKLEREIERQRAQRKIHEVMGEGFHPDRLEHVSEVHDFMARAARVQWTFLILCFRNPRETSRSSWGTVFTIITWPISIVGSLVVVVYCAIWIVKSVL
jgi:hypothetical protein